MFFELIRNIDNKIAEDNIDLEERNLLEKLKQQLVWDNTEKCRLRAIVDSINSKKRESDCLEKDSNTI